MRKIISIIITCLSLIPLIYLTSITSHSEGNDNYSEEDVIYYVVLPKEKYLSSAPYIAYSENNTNIESLKEYLRESLLNFSTRIDISSYNISKDDLPVIEALVFHELVDCFHVYNKGYGCELTSNIVDTLIFTYIYNEEEYSEKLEEVELSASNLLKGIEDNNSLTDVQKALLIHDRLALHCEYDQERLENGTIPDESYNIYGILAKGKAVCEGYAEAYKYLLEKVGINSVICTSEILNHAWNIVYIDNTPYHVDVTWDDPVWDICGRVLHKNFLISSDELYETGHKANDYDTTPIDTTYDDYFWENSETAFQLLDGNIYYIDSVFEELKLYNGTKLCSVEDMWFVSQKGYYDGMSRLASDGEDLYYSLSDSVYKYDITTGQSEKVFKPNHNFGEYFGIYGFAYKNGEFICELNNYPNFDCKTKSLYTISFTIENEKHEVSVEGSISSDLGFSADPIVIKLFGLNESLVYSTETSDGKYSISVPPGEYTLEVSKKDHATLTDTVTVEKDSVLDIKLNLIGDITGEGAIDSNDIKAALEHFKNSKDKELSGYAFSCADVTGDGQVNILDINRMNLHINKRLLLWSSVD